MGEREYPLAWRHDCQGKQDYDGRIVEVSTRYWPPNYDRDGQHTAHSSILLGGVEVVDANFTAQTIAECKRLVEEWVAGKIQSIEQAVTAALGPAPGAPTADHLLQALDGYPRMNTQLLQATKVCTGVKALAEQLAREG